jgi:hypothetical protein
LPKSTRGAETDERLSEALRLMDVQAFMRGGRETRFSMLFALAAMVGRMTPRSKSPTAGMSKYRPHEGDREIARRKAQIARGMLQVTPA